MFTVRVKVWVEEKFSVLLKLQSVIRQIIFAVALLCDMCVFSPQNAIVQFKELCGLSAVANLKQCILALSSRLIAADNNPVVLFNLKDQYPVMEAQGLLPDVLKKVATAYETVRPPFVCMSTVTHLSTFFLDLCSTLFHSPTVTSPGIHQRSFSWCQFE